MKNVTIIGGGPCGVAVGIELFLQIVNRKLQHKIKITLLEKDAEIGYGLAFRTDQPGHLLNTQADLMGIHADEPRHFAGWLKVHGGKNRKDVKGEGETEDSYTTRKLYGDYVSAQAQYYFQKARETGVQFNLLR
ncbi:MAG TPA: FAD/NAD(P)-binding protein, partial [Cyclobacteriaceae bacterium]|nr:FAD/NAD(P)-binding protein [Cyclobacteriaceae bacterium]